MYCVVALLTHLDEAVVVEEAEHGGAGGRVVAEPCGGDVGDDLLHRGTRPGVEVQRQPVPLRRPPACTLPRGRQRHRRLPSTASAHAAAEVHNEEQDEAAETDASGGIHCRGLEEEGDG